MIVIADLHLGKISDSIITNNQYSQIADTEARLDELLKVAAEIEETIVIAGDVFNKVNPPTWVIGVFFDWLGCCKDAGVKVVILPGNHDGSVNWVNIGMLTGLNLDNVLIVTDITDIIIDDVPVMLVPHLPLAIQENIYETHGGLGEYITLRYAIEKRPDVLIGHGMPKGMDYKNDIFFEAGEALTFDLDAFPKFKLMVLGHVHKHYHMIKKGKGDIVSPGSPTYVTFDEVDDFKGYIHIDETGAWEHVEYQSAITPYRYVEIDLLQKDDIDFSLIENIAKGAIVKIKVLARNSLQVDEVAIRKEFNKHGYVSRFEVSIDWMGQRADVKTVLSEDSYEDLLRKHVGSTKESSRIKKLAIEIGNQIIQGVLEHVENN